MDQGNSCFIPIVHGDPGTLPIPCRLAMALGPGEENVPVVVRERGLSRDRRGDCMWFMHGILYVYLTWQAAAIQMLLRSSYIIISTFQSLDVQGLAGFSECQEHFREGNHMLFWPVINEKCPHYIETLRMPKSVGTVYVPLLKYSPAVMYVLTTLNQLTLQGINFGQPRPRSTKTTFSRR